MAIRTLNDSQWPDLYVGTSIVFIFDGISVKKKMKNQTNNKKRRNYVFFVFFCANSTNKDYTRVRHEQRIALPSSRYRIFRPIYRRFFIAIKSERVAWKTNIPHDKVAPGPI